MNPANDCPTTATGAAGFPTDSATESAHSISVDPSTGTSGATVSWPRARSSASTRCQYQPESPAPWIKTNVATWPSSRRRDCDDGAVGITREALAHRLGADVGDVDRLVETGLITARRRVHLHGWGRVAGTLPPGAGAGWSTAGSGRRGGSTR